MIYQGITVFASESDCLADAPDPYRSLMYYSHFLTLPLYTLTIYVLIFKTPGSLRAYRRYLLWHTVGNLIFEVYISTFMLPVAYLPYLVFRGAGILKYFNVSGVVQFYFLVTALVHTGVSVMELFKYRFDATIREDTLNKKIVHKYVLIFWVVGFLIPIGGFSTLPLTIPNQEKYKRNLWIASPGISIEVLCYTSVTSPPLVGWIFTPLIILMITSILTAALIVPHITITILAKLEKLSRHMSKKTIELQKMLLISLFIQAAIHAVMLGIPIVTFVYSIIFSLSDNNLAYLLLILISFHGSFSTVAMIGFTKPIRHGVLQIIGQVVPVLSPNKNVTIVSFSNSEFKLDPRNSIFQYRNSIYG